MFYYYYLNILNTCMHANKWHLKRLHYFFFLMHLIFAFQILDNVLTKDIHLFNCFLLYFALSRPFPLPPPFLQRSHTQQKKKRKVSVAAVFCITDKDHRCLHLCADLDLLIQSWTPDLRRETYVERNERMAVKLPLCFCTTLTRQLPPL